MKTLTVAAQLKEIETLTDFVNEELENYMCPMKTQMQIAVALDEILANIVHYAYPDNPNGKMSVTVSKKDNKIILVFADNGIPYNPLTHEDPDTTLSAEDRQIGGLGIFLVKKTMDSCDYQYLNGQNILTLTKNF